MLGKSSFDFLFLIVCLGCRKSYIIIYKFILEPEVGVSKC